VLNVTTGTVKRHAGSFVWETQVGGSASARVGFWGATPVVQPSGADQAAVTPGNVDGATCGLMISDPSTLPDVQTLRDKAEELADDVRALATRVQASSFAPPARWCGAQAQPRRSVTSASTAYAPRATPACSGPSELSRTDDRQSHKATLNRSPRYTPTSRTTTATGVMARDGNHELRNRDPIKPRG
jgi:hypothetical protein